MTDPRRYDAAERLAMAQIAEWRVMRTFRPAHFEAVGFPTSINDLGEVKYMTSAMSDSRGSERVLREMRGLRDHDLLPLYSAIDLYIKYYTTFIDPKNIQIPYNILIYYYSLYKKLKNFPNHATILDIGSGVGCLPFFIHSDNSFQTYNQIEVTQSLYITQSTVNSFVFQDNQCEMSAIEVDMPDAPSPSDVLKQWALDDNIRLQIKKNFRCTLFPWWQIQMAFVRKYDIIMCNENICEMPDDAFLFFMKKISESLNPNGLLFVHGIGQTSGDRQKLIDDRLTTLSLIGYRAIVAETSFENNGSLSRPNLILAHSQHTDYDKLPKNLFARCFDRNDPLVQGIYGLTEPDGSIQDLSSLRAMLCQQLDQTYRPEA
ncbi:hypothetical protein [Thalassobaculum sp.]